MDVIKSLTRIKLGYILYIEYFKANNCKSIFTPHPYKSDYVFILETFLMIVFYSYLEDLNKKI